jgi:4-amino-4-deoxy-L-arabinose transferase-like glycosyltransferase
LINKQYRLAWQRLEYWAAEPSHYRRAIIGICAVALALRVIVALVHPYYLPDSADYSALAKAIAAGHAYEVHGQMARRMPGYPIFMAGFYRVFGDQHLPILLAQAVLSALTAVFAAMLGRCVSPAVGLLAGALAAMDPLGIGFAASLLTEPLFTCVFILSLLMLTALMQRPGRWGLWLIFSVVWAMGVYVRAEVSLCIFPLLAWCIFVARPAQRAKSIIGSVLTLLIVLICLLPWWMRNNALFHQDFFRFTTMQGISLYESVYSGATGGPRQSDLVVPAAIKRLNESRRDLAWTHRAFTDMFQHPGRMIRLAFVKIARTWSPWLHARGYARPWLNVLLTLWYGPLFVLALIGVCRYPIRSPLFGMLLVPIVYFTCMHAVFLGSVRYRVPVMPLVMVLAAIALAPSVRRPDAAPANGLGAGK